MMQSRQRFRLPLLFKSRLYERACLYMAWLFDTFGMKPTLLMTKGFVAWFALSGAYLGWFASEGGSVLLGMLVAFYVWVIAHNLRQYQR